MDVLYIRTYVPIRFNYSNFLRSIRFVLSVNVSTAIF